MKIVPATLLLLAIANAQDPCTSSGDCAEGEYCGAGVCTANGACATRDDCFNPNNGPYAVAACVGIVDCLEGQCGITCGPDMCPDGIESPCDPDNLPCDTTECPGADACFNDPCNAEACSAVFYDAAGNVMEECGVPSQLPETEPPVATQLPANPDQCASDADCEGFLENGEASYCNAGMCVQMGFCSTDNDCKNPSNKFAIIECVGVLSCDENGQCGVECGPSFCEEGVEEAPCETDPCLDFKFGCPMAKSCAPNACGECSAIYFDEAGNDLGDCMPVIEQPMNGNTSFAMDPCMSDMDCEEGEYCGDGVCLAMGECTQRIDCWNPANVYGIGMCVGLIDCFDGPNGTMACGIECGPKECPGGEERTPCPEPSTCNVTNCDEAVSCNFDGCGGECTEIYFDEAGTQVCVEEKTTCSSDADCNPVAEARQGLGTGSYCAQGVCMDKGMCMTDLDCMNPANERPIPACVGYPSCEMGQCAWTCGPACADGNDWAVCEEEPCANTTCAAAVSCANDYCSGGCNALHFDAAGNEVTDCDAVPTNFNTNDDSGASFLFSSLSAFGILAMAAMLFV